MTDMHCIDRLLKMNLLNAVIDTPSIDRRLKKGLSKVTRAGAALPSSFRWISVLLPAGYFFYLAPVIQGQGHIHDYANDDEESNSGSHSAVTLFAESEVERYFIYTGLSMMVDRGGRVSSRL